MLWRNTSLICYSAKTFISMETNFNFKSQVCTDKVQSERLLALGLKKETADMVWVEASYGDDGVPDARVKDKVAIVFYR